MKQFSVAMLGYGIAGKAFARILNQTHDEIMEKTGYDVKVVAITTGSRGSLYCICLLYTSLPEERVPF